MQLLYSHSFCALSLSLALAGPDSEARPHRARDSEAAGRAAARPPGRRRQKFRVNMASPGAGPAGGGGLPPGPGPGPGRWRLPSREKTKIENAQSSEQTSAKWAVHIYYQHAEYEPCTILHIGFGTCIFSDIYICKIIVQGSYFAYSAYYNMQNM